MDNLVVEEQVFVNMVETDGPTVVDDDDDGGWGIIKDVANFHWLMPTQRHRTKEDALSDWAEALLVAGEGLFILSARFSGMNLIVGLLLLLLVSRFKAKNTRWR